MRSVQLLCHQNTNCISMQLKVVTPTMGGRMIYIVYSTSQQFVYVHAFYCVTETTIDHALSLYGTEQA